MRTLRKTQLELFCNYPIHSLGQELRQISKILDRHLEFSNWVHEDLCKEKHSSGDEGMTSEQVLRAGILKQHLQVSYEELAFRLQDSLSSRSFIILNDNEWYGSSCLQENIKRISENTWNRIFKSLLEESRDSGMEKARTVRIDSTVSLSNIHHPTDSSLLVDCLRVMKREFKKLRVLVEKPHWRLPVPLKEGKSLLFKIHNCDDSGKRTELYRKLIRKSKKVRGELFDVLKKLEKLADDNSDISLLVCQDTLINLVQQQGQIIEQATKRVLNNKKVPSAKKIVSIFEPHTDIIVKDRRDTYFGHKVFLTSGKSNLIVDFDVPAGNPCDTSMLMPAIERLNEQYGRYPRQISADGGFASKENVDTAKGNGVKDVCFGKPCGLKITDMVKSTWVFKKLRNWRAGIEGVISFLKRGFGLSLCNWSGLSGFRKYVASSIIAYNLTIMARFELKNA